MTATVLVLALLVLGMVAGIASTEPPPLTVEERHAAWERIPDRVILTVKNAQTAKELARFRELIDGWDTTAGRIMILETIDDVVFAPGETGPILTRMERVGS